MLHEKNKSVKTENSTNRRLRFCIGCPIDGQKNLCYPVGKLNLLVLRRPLKIKINLDEAKHSLWRDTLHICIVYHSIVVCLRPFFICQTGPQPENRKDGCKMYWPEDSVFITGVAKVTKDDAINAMYGTFSLSLVVDVHSNRILSASGNMVMQNTNDFLASLLIGKNIVTQMDEMCDILKKRFLALAQKAVVVALRDAQNHYLMAYPAARENPTGI